MVKELQDKIDGTITAMVNLVSDFNQEKINVVPFEGSWTAGQLAKHVIMSDTGFLQMVNGPVRETDRAPDQLVDNIKETFLDFNTKMQSPDFVLPPKTNYDKQDLLGSLEDIKLKAIDSIDKLELDKTCLAFELPVYGYLTRLEALNFLLYHTQRHLQQLKNISEKIVDMDKDTPQQIKNEEGKQQPDQ